jgi:hypothetical protein
VASSEIVCNVTDTVLLPGLYYFGMSADGTNNYLGWSPAQVGISQTTGIKRMSTAFPLPDPATYATPTTVFFPNVNATLRSD